MGFSVISEAFGIGLVPRFAISWPAALALFLFVDSLTSYCVHRTMHSLPLFWRIHRVHHADIAVDISTSLRNHPLELAITMPVFALWALVIGAPAEVVAVAQTIAFAAAMGQHADISFPPRLDRLLSLIIVTPNMHRLHHSPHRIVHDGNYGDLITLWDLCSERFAGASCAHESAWMARSPAQTVWSSRSGRQFTRPEPVILPPMFRRLH